MTGIHEVIHTSREEYVETIAKLKDDGYVMCVDVTAVDYLGLSPVRFEVVVNLLSMNPPRRARVRVQVPEEDPKIASLFSLYPGTEAMEREVFDLMGIRFDGHPDLTRILMPEDWEGHPLRKDYVVGRIPVQFKAAPATR